LRRWDEYIERLEHKIALKKQLKKGLLHQLLTGKRRHAGFTNAWHLRKFQDIFVVLPKKAGYKISEYSAHGDIPIFDQSYEKYVSGYTERKDKIVDLKSDTILFGDHSRIVKFIPGQPIAVGNDGIKLITVQRDVDPYFAYLILSNYHVPNTGYNRHFKYLVDANFNMPSYEEQLAISNVVRIVDQEIKLGLCALRKLTTQKRYLLKKLITGKIRIPECINATRGDKEKKNA
jgi:type I restriction enzyme S subunit